MEKLLNRYSSKTAWLMALNATWGSFIFGYNIGVMAPLEDCLAAYFRWDNNDSLYFYLFTPMMHLGAVLGALTAGPLSHRTGRRKALIWYDLVVLIGCALVAIPMLPFYPIGRFVCGVAAGGFAAVVPTYLKEASPTELYNLIASLVQLQIALGICVSYGLALGLPTESYETSAMTNFWIFIYTFQGFIAILQLATFVCVYKYDTPYWLLRKKQSLHALAALQQVYCPEEASKQLEKVQEVVDIRINLEILTENQLENPPIKDLLCCKPGTTKMMRIGLLVNIFQQTVGINAVLSYLSIIFQQFSSDVLTIRVLTLSGGIANMLGVVLIFPLIQHFGRKTLLVWGNLSLLVCLLGVGGFELGESKLGPAPAIVMIILYMTCFECGIGSVCWIYCGEILSENASSICIGANWIANFVTVLMFPFLLENLGFTAVFGIYGMIAGCSVIYFCVDLVETAGLSQIEIKKLIHRQL